MLLEGLRVLSFQALSGDAGCACASCASCLEDTADAKVEPSTYTITDGSYSVYKRRLYMNVDNKVGTAV